MLRYSCQLLFNHWNGGGAVQLVGRQASSRKVAKPWFAFRCGSASLCSCERHLTLFPVLGRSISLPVAMAQPDERHANRTASGVGVIWQWYVLEWYDRRRANNIWFKRRRRTTQVWKYLVKGLLWFLMPPLEFSAFPFH